MGLTAIGQIQEISKSMLSPNATSLGEYGEVPVSPFTGIPKIEIPLTEIEAGNHKLPISLSYHAGGVRPDQHPGWVGVGWTLNAGGCISRVVKDSIDEYCLTNKNNNLWRMNEFGYYYNYAQLDDPNWYNINGYFTNGIMDTVNYKDYEPDEFLFSFLDYQGKFYLSPTGEWVVQCSKPVKIAFNNEFIDPFEKISYSHTEFTNGCYSKSFSGFAIISENGTKYIFGGDWNAIEFSVPFFFLNSCEPHATSWYLTKIIYPDSREIRFNYDKDGFVAQLGISYYNRTYYSWKDELGWHPGEESTGFNGKIFDGALIIPSYLSSIETDSKKVIFNRATTNDLQYDLEKIWAGRRPPRGEYDPYTLSYFLPLLYDNSTQPYYYGGDSLRYSALKWMKLSNISIELKNNDLCTTHWDFIYNDTIKTRQRLFLQKINESSGNELGKRYIFDYCSPDSLPDYAADMTDHWGFYNGIKAQYDDFDNYYTYREPNQSVGQYGILKRITYPTGGYTEFTFEPHDYSSVVNDYRTGVVDVPDSFAGGLRIKKIVSKSSINEDSVSLEYLYVKDYTPNGNISSQKSSGVLGVIPQYVFKDYSPRPLNLNYIKEIKMNVFSTNSVLPGTENSCGSHIGYSEVVEKNYDGSYKRYVYSNFDNGYCDETAVTSLQQQHLKYEPFTSKSFERGLPLSVEEYDGFDSGFNLRRKTIYQYEKDDSTIHNYAPAVRLRLKELFNIVGNIYVGFYVEGTAYKNYTYQLRQKCIIDTVYEQNNHAPLIQVTNFAYNSNKLISNVNKTIANGQKRGVDYIYPQENLYPHLYARHILSAPIEKIEYTNENNGNRNNTHKTYTHYDNNKIFPTAISTAKGDSPYEQRYQYEYDCFGNIIHEIVDSIQHTVYLWGYKGQYLVAVIENATLDEVVNIVGDINIFARLEIPIFYTLGLLRTALPDAQVTTYRYKVGVGIETKTNPNGSSLFYEYDQLGRLSCIKDTNGNIIEAYNYNYAF